MVQLVDAVERRERLADVVFARLEPVAIKMVEVGEAAARVIVSSEVTR